MRWLAAWMFYCAGDVVSRPMQWFDRAAILYPIYNWLMTTSTRIQGNGKGPWGPIQSPRS